MSTHWGERQDRANDPDSSIFVQHKHRRLKTGRDNFEQVDACRAAARAADDSGPLDEILIC
jgi:hypothetical protein